MLLLFDRLNAAYVAVSGGVMLVPAAKVIVPPVSFEMAMPPPVPVMVFVMPLNEYVPELLPIEMPVDVPLPVTFQSPSPSVKVVGAWSRVQTFWS